MLAVVVLYVSEERPGEGVGGVCDEEEVAGEGEEGEECEEGGAVFYALFPGGGERVEEGAGERHCGRITWGNGGF